MSAIPARLDGRVAVITGAGNGIGRATAARFIAEGATVVGVDIDEAALADAQSELGPKFEPFPADVSNATPRHDYIAHCRERHGRVDISFLNAAIIGESAPIHEYDLAVFDRVMAINVRGVWIGTSRSLAAMREQRSGVITITSSTGGLRGGGDRAAYNTSKHAIVGIMKSAAIEGGPFGIRVNAIHPGAIDTGMLPRGRWAFSEENQMASAGQAPGLPQLYRIADASEVAAMVAFLSSDEASFSTGASFLVDGGLMAGPPYGS